MKAPRVRVPRRLSTASRVYVEIYRDYRIVREMLWWGLYRPANDQWEAGGRHGVRSEDHWTTAWRMCRDR